jgi:NAD(P)-dependent dehydrogenase (short-subunit alcohol dehydrogenase family)
MKILITGASKGIGSFLMAKFLADGKEVFGTFNSTVPPVTEVNLTKVDITVIEEVKKWIEKICTTDDQIALVNCAGANYNALAHKAEIVKWKKIIDVNLVGTFNLISTVLPFMREKGYGRIINFASVVPQKGVPGTSAYSASKAGLWGLTKSIASENAKKGITINTLNLGYYDIGMITEVPEEILQGIIKSIPVQKLGNPENIYNAINFLISSDYITGTSIDINGGLF